MGIIALCFSLVLLFTDYRVSDKNDFNTFIIVISGFLGLIFTFIGLYSKTETEYGIRNKWHEKELE